MNELKVLMVEDSEKDAALILREMRRAGYEPMYRRVETADEMKAALNAESWDVILCDHALPEFNGLDALELLRCRDRELPFIIVSGHIGEDLAVEAMKAGANDYIMKSNLKRLGPAVQREIRDAQVRRESRHLQAELEKTEEELKVSKQVQQMKDEFLGMVSHELKSPLTVIIGALSVAVSEEIPPEEADELVRDALSSAESLGIIIDNLLELARYQKSRLSLSLQPCNVGEVVSSVVRKLQTKSPVHRLVTKIPEDIPTIPADPVRVERVLYNLVENAIKYSPEGGEVRIGLRWTTARGRR
jgi:signal transduction histidine kinase